MSELQRVLAALNAAYAWSVETGKGGRPSTEALHDAARVIRELSAQLEAEEATNDRLRDEIAEAVGARERMAAEVERLKQELAEATAARNRLQQVVEAFGDGGEKGPSVWAFIDEWPTLKEKAKALEELEAWLRENQGCRAQTYALSRSDEVSFRLDVVAQTAHRAPTLAAAIRAALEKARGA